MCPKSNTINSAGIAPDDDVEDILGKLEIFANLDLGELRLLAGIARRVSFYASEMIFEDTSPGEDLYVILSGQVTVQIEAITPNESVILTNIGAGEILGEFSIIDSGPRSATAICQTDTTALSINGKRMHELFGSHPRMGYIVMKNIAKIICERIRRTNRRLLSSLKRKDF